MGFLDKVKKALGSDKNNDENLKNGDVENTSVNTVSSHYDSDEPYIFACYSYEDSHIVSEDIRRFQKSGLNVWHDEDIYFNPEHSKEVRNAILNSSLFVLFLSQNSVESSLVKDELTLALNYNLPSMIIFLEEVELDGWFMWALSNKMTISKFEIPDYGSYIESCAEAMQDALNVQVDKPSPEDNGISSRYPDDQVDQNLNTAFDDGQDSDHLQGIKSDVDGKTEDSDAGDIAEFKNFRYLDDLIHSGLKEIVLDSDIILSSNEQSEYADGIPLDVDGLVIDGNGHNIDANHKARIFECSGKEVMLKNITLQNGSAMIAGAIKNDGEMTISQSELKDNVVEQVGGAIVNEGRLTISESRIGSNISQMQTAGAIANGIHCRLTIIKSEFSSNKARYGGGAIFNLGTVEISESRFHSNSNTYGMTDTASSIAFFKTQADKNMYSGGAIVNGESGVMTITGSVMTSNYGYVGGAIGNEGQLNISSSKLFLNVAYYAGAIFNNSKLEVDQSEFISNETDVFARGLDDSVWWTNDGGAIVNDGILDMANTNFKGNRSPCNGGAIVNNSKLTMTESCLMKNSAKEGGAIFNTMNLKANDCKILSNDSSGSIVYNRDRMQFYNTVFQDNQSAKVIFNEVDDSNLFVFATKFIGNTVKDAVLENKGDSCTVEKCIFSKNLSDGNSRNIANHSNLTFIDSKIEEDGKTISNEGHVLLKRSPPDIESRIYGKGRVERSMVHDGEKFDFEYLDKKIHEGKAKEIVLKEDITLERYESDFYEGGIELDIDGLVIDGNGKCIDGAGKSRIFLITGDNITLKNITFKNGMAYRSYDNIFNSNGGAVKSNHNTRLKIENCRFINNGSRQDGGAIYNPGELDICESSFTDNVANHDGGAIFNAGELSIAKSSFKHNNAGHDGGAIHNGGLLTVKESEFSNNSIKEYEINIGQMTISEFRRNVNITSEYFGGAIGSYGNLTVIDSQFNNNTANCGGAIGNGGKLTMIRSKLSNNNVWQWGSGGGIFSNEGELKIEDSIFKKNLNYAIYSLKSKYEPQNCTFKRNKPDDVYEEND